MKTRVLRFRVTAEHEDTFRSLKDLDADQNEDVIKLRSVATKGVEVRLLLQTGWNNDGD